MERRRSRILLMEDDPARAGIMVDLLLAADYEVDGPYASVSDAMAALAAHVPDGAILDLHEGAEAEGMLKEDLEAYDIPFLDHPGAVDGRLLPWLRRVRH